jgi:hypothetical protein
VLKPFFDRVSTTARAGIAQSIQRRATGHKLQSWFSITGRVKIFLFLIASTPALVPTQSPIQRVQGALSPRVKRQGREADHSPPSSADVKTGRAVSSLPHTSSWRGV